MAVTYTVALFSAASNSLEETSDKVTATAVYQILASEPTTLAHARANASAADTSLPAQANVVPLRRSLLPDTTDVPCVKRTFRFADATRCVILATLEYDNTRNAVLSPLQEDPVISSGPEQSEETYSADTQTPPKLARHTNNVPFDELPKRNSAIRVYDVEINVEASDTDATYSGLENKVNDASTDVDGRTCDAGTLLCSGVSLSSIKTRDGVQYKTLKFTLRYRASGWDQKYESLGFVDASGKPIDDGSGNPVQRPYPLKADGSKATNVTDKGAEIVLKPYAAGDVASLLA